MLGVQQFRIFALIFRLSFIEEQFGEHAFVRRVHNIIPFGYVAVCKRVNGVDVSKALKALYTGFFFQKGRSRCQKFVFPFNKLG